MKKLMMLFTRCRVLVVKDACFVYPDRLPQGKYSFLWLRSYIDSCNLASNARWAQDAGATM